MAIIIISDIKDIPGFVQKARDIGELKAVSNIKAYKQISSAIAFIINTPRGPSGGKKLKCKKSCDSTAKATGKCVLGGCLMIKFGGFPPKPTGISWSFPI